MSDKSFRCLMRWTAPCGFVNGIRLNAWLCTLGGLFKIGVPCRGERPRLEGITPSCKMRYKSCCATSNQWVRTRSTRQKKIAFCPGCPSRCEPTAQSLGNTSRGIGLGILSILPTGIAAITSLPGDKSSRWCAASAQNHWQFVNYPTTHIQTTTLRKLACSVN